MGYFRLFYYIAYVLNFVMRMLKRHGKFLLLLACIFIFLVVCMYTPKSNGAYVGNDDYFDPVYATYKDYESTMLDLVRRVENLPSSYDTIKEEFINNITANRYGYFVYYATNDSNIQNVNSINNNIGTLRVLVYYRNINYTQFSQTIYDNYRGITNDIYNVTTTDYYLYALGLSNLILLSSGDGSGANSLSVYMPSVLYGYNSSVFNNYFVNNYTLEQTQLLYEMDEKLASVDDTLQQQQEYLEEEPSSDDFSASDLPSDSGVTDTTETGLTNIFSQIYNAFTGSPSNQNNIIVPIPFTR